MFLAALLATAGARAADGLRFAAGAAAHWQFSRSDAACDLAQAIPDFGVARFHRALDQSLSFELVPQQPVLARAPVEVATFAPVWLPGGPDPRPVATVASNGDAVRIGGDEAEAVMRAMFVGRAAEVRQRATNLVVEVSAVSFRAPYDEFGVCSSDLRAARFAAYERTSLPFGANGDALDDAARARCDAIAHYVRDDSSIARVFVDGHTDASGDAKKNLVLSRRRADIVASELIAAGVPADKVVVRYHAARYPIKSNESEEGRRANRRTTIRLAREDAVANR